MSKVYTTRVQDELGEKIEEIAKKRKRSVSYILREALDIYVNENLNKDDKDD